MRGHIIGHVVLSCNRPRPVIDVDFFTIRVGIHGDTHFNRSVIDVDFFISRVGIHGDTHFLPISRFTGVECGGVHSIHGPLLINSRVHAKYHSAFSTK